jgi:hypothetical protein
VEPRGKLTPRPKPGEGFLFFGKGVTAMAKRKRKPGSRKGFKLRMDKNYRDERYVMYIANAETGILQAGTIDADLTDGDVYRALEDLISKLQKPGTYEKLFPREMPKEPDEVDPDDRKDIDGMVQGFILMNLRSAFQKHGPLEAEDVIGILGVIKTSVKRWSVGMHRRGYLTYIEGFLGQMGVRTWQLSPEEVENLELYRAPDQLDEGGNHE